MELFSISSSSKSKSACNHNQNFAEFPKYLLSRKALFALILRFPFTISEIQIRGISVSFANLLAEMFNEIKNSIDKISPG